MFRPSLLLYNPALPNVVIQNFERGHDNRLFSTISRDLAVALIKQHNNKRLRVHCNSVYISNRILTAVNRAIWTSCDCFHLLAIVLSCMLWWGAYWSFCMSTTWVEWYFFSLWWRSNTATGTMSSTAPSDRNTSPFQTLESCTVTIILCSTLYTCQFISSDLHFSPKVSIIIVGKIAHTAIVLLPKELEK